MDESLKREKRTFSFMNANQAAIWSIRVWQTHTQSLSHSTREHIAELDEAKQNMMPKRFR